jgi:hypothetical protein
MVDVLKTAQVVSELTMINRTYGKERIIITSDKGKAEGLKRLSTFTGKYSSDDLSVPEKVKELLDKNRRVLMIIDNQILDIYHF